MKIRITQRCQGRYGATYEPGMEFDFPTVLAEGYLRRQVAVLVKDEPVVAESAPASPPGVDFAPDDDHEAGAVEEPGFLGLEEMTVSEAKRLLEGADLDVLRSARDEEAGGKARMTLLRAIDEAVDALG